MRQALGRGEKSVGDGGGSHRREGGERRQVAVPGQHVARDAHGRVLHSSGFQYVGTV
jgi:hypothetical protein